MRVPQFDKALVLVDTSHRISAPQLEELVHSVICQQVLGLCQMHWYRRQSSNRGSLIQNGGWWEIWQEVHHLPLRLYRVVLVFFSFLSFSPSSPSPFLMCHWPDMSTHQDLSAGRLASSGSREFRSQWICEGDTLTLLLLTNCYPAITFCRQLDWELINLCLLKHLTLCFSDRQEIPVRVWKTDAFNLYFY